MELFSSRNPQADFDQRALSLGAAKHVPVSGFLENWGEALRLDLDEASSISRMLNQELHQERQNEIWRLYESGDIPKEVMQQHTIAPTASRITEFDYNALSRWANDNLGTEFMSDEEIMDNIRDDLKTKRDLAQEVFSRANWWGKFGQFAGAAHAAAIDPALLPSYFIGIGAGARGLTWFSRFGRTAAITGGAEAGLEIVRQPMIYAWKQEIASDYSFNDAMTNIITAGLGAGVIAGSASALSSGLRRVVRKNAIYGSSTSDEAVRAVDGTIRELDRAPDANMDAREHMGSLEAETQRQQTRPTHVDEPLPEPDTPEVDTKPIPEEDLDTEVVLETVEGESITVTVRQAAEMADELERQAELARGCF